MDTYYTYNLAEKRLEVVIETFLALSFNHDETEDGNAYIMFNLDSNNLGFYSGGVLVRSYEG